MERVTQLYVSSKHEFFKFDVAWDASPKQKDDVEPKKFGRPTLKDKLTDVERKWRSRGSIPEDAAKEMTPERISLVLEGAKKKSKPRGKAASTNKSPRRETIRVKKN